MPRLKTFLQALTLLSAAAYVSIFLYQRNVTVATQLQTNEVEVGWQERALRSLSENYVEGAEGAAGSTATPKPPKDVMSRLRRTLLSRVEVGWQERAPRSLSENYVEGAEGSAGASGSTATPKPPLARPQDVFISVKTTGHYHRARLPVIIKTWFQLAKEQIWFFTDSDDPEFQQKTGGHMINTNCSSSHNRKALCCKMSVEFDSFLNSDKKWFCHFDDDNYVNVPRLIQLLGDYNHQEDWYLGKPSIRAPLEILNRESKSPVKQNISFWFATGGAGFCLSRALALKMLLLAGDGKFMSIGEKIRLPDDVTMGYIIEHLLRKPLTVVDQFHSHLEPMKFLRQDTFHDQITFSYSRYGKDEVNVIKIDGFDHRIDPTRFLSLHCFLFPYYAFCPR